MLGGTIVISPAPTANGDLHLGPAVWARAAVGGDGFHTTPFVADRPVEAAAQRPAA